ncbi:hypothetical protein GE061_017985 [Apolygus lucorum]|uniref:RWD domain-containing protein n=1 Tax=Apolygus lucorum TaxID=248454 RepID=A0A8S9XDW1_APOLU|nr:hypothetical protein GE061_017985 [Apolygus lucorum]
MDEQEEEREVVMAIYDGDPAFHQLTPVTYQYKYGEDGDPKSFLIELSWTENYPNEAPSFNMDTFYNKHVSDSIKKKIAGYLKEEAENLKGFAMTYSLFEGVKEKLDSFLVDAEPAEAVVATDAADEKDEEVSSDSENVSPTKKAVKKEHLTKAQKRKQWDRLDNKGERPRGWDWVDVIQHLGQTGPKVDSSTT